MAEKGGGLFGFLRKRAESPSQKGKPRPLVSSASEASGIQKYAPVERVDLTGETLEVEKAVEQIESRVKGRSFYGRIINQLHMKGATAVGPKDFAEHGSEITWRGDPSREFFEAMRGNYNDPEIDAKRKSHFIVAFKDPRSKLSVVSYIFPTSNRDLSNRWAGGTIVSFQLENQDAVRLLGVIRKDPDAAEMFLQRAAQGFEAKPGSDPIRPDDGVSRIRSDSIGIVNLEKILNNPNKSACFKNQNEEIEVLEYKNPHGLIDPSLAKP